MKRLLLLALLPALGCHPPAPAKPLTPQEAYGRQVFGALCSNCHNADSEEGLTGPGLQGLFRKKYLPSGGATNDARVTSVIVRGRGMMPAMGNTLTDQQLTDLLAYLHTL